MEEIMDFKGMYAYSMIDGWFSFLFFFFSLVIRGETVWSKVSMKLEHRVQQNHERQHGQHSTQNGSTAGVSVGRAVLLNRWCSSPITVKPSGVICSLTLMPADCINAWNDKFSWSVNVGPEGGARVIDSQSCRWPKSSIQYDSTSTLLTVAVPFKDHCRSDVKQ